MAGLSSMAVDFDKGMRPNLYELMQEGPGGELHPATADTLGGVKIGRGVDVTEDGTISVTAPAPVDTYTKEEIDEQQEAQDYNITSNTLAIERLESGISAVYTKSEIDSQQQAQDSNISANATDIVTIKGDIDSIKAEQITQNTNINVNAQSILAHTNQINSLADYNDTQDASIASNTTAIAANTTAIANNATAIQNEATARESMDTTLASNIAANVAAIAAEVAARESGDSELQSALDALTEALNTLSETIATDSQLGLIKTDSTKFIETDSDGKLIIGGRLGQFSSEEMPNGGLYYPLSIQPEVVWKNSFLITEGTLVSTRSSRIFALAAGTNVTLKTAAAAGATRFEVSNTFANRFSCAIARNGYATIQEGTAGTIMVHVTNVYLANDPDKTPLVPYSGATESGNNIIIETDAPLSDTDTVTRLRLYGTMTFDSSFHCGQGNGTGGVTGKGKILQLGQNILSLEGNSIFVGNGIFNNKNRVCIVGANHINYVQGACLTGEGHDTTNGTFVGLAEHGKYSITNANTAFAIGNGTNNTTRSNLFEIADDNGTTAMMVKSPNGTEFKITVDDSGNIVTSQV